MSTPDDYKHVAGGSLKLKGGLQLKKYERCCLPPPRRPCRLDGRVGLTMGWPSLTLSQEEEVEVGQDGQGGGDGLVLDRRLGQRRRRRRWWERSAQDRGREAVRGDPARKGACSLIPGLSAAVRRSSARGMTGARSRCAADVGDGLVILLLHCLGAGGDVRGCGHVDTTALSESVAQTPVAAVVGLVLPSRTSCRHPQEPRLTSAPSPRPLAVSQLAERIAKTAGQTHKDRVAEFNEKLEGLSESVPPPHSLFHTPPPRLSRSLVPIERRFRQATSDLPTRRLLSILRFQFKADPFPSRLFPTTNDNSSRHHDIPRVGPG